MPYHPSVLFLTSTSSHFSAEDKKSLSSSQTVCATRPPQISRKGFSPPIGGLLKWKRCLVRFRVTHSSVWLHCYPGRNGQSSHQVSSRSTAAAPAGPRTA